MANVLTLLLIPVGLTDPRRWHWQALSVDALRSGRPELMVLSSVTLFLVRLQVAGIYLHSCIAKLGVREWRDGTALYYWLRDPSFGTSSWLRPLTDWLVLHPVTVLGLTWGTIALEFSLAIAILLQRPARRALLLGGITLHLGIAICMGLWSFALVMCGALLLHLHYDDEIRVPAIFRGARPSSVPGVLAGDRS